MEGVGHLDVRAAKTARLDNNLLCIICQTERNDTWVEKPAVSSYQKLLSFIRERALYGDNKFPVMSKRLGDVTWQDLQAEGCSWHRKCYQETVHTQLLNRARERYGKKLISNSEDSQPSSSTFTRSQSSPYNKELCFFCENGAQYNNPLHLVTTNSAGESLKYAVEMSGNDKLLVKLSTAIDPEDAHAIDIKYHKRCWATHVTNVKRPTVRQQNQSNVNVLAADIEFLSLLENTLLNGNVVSMAEAHEAYTGILSANNVNINPSRKKTKQIIQEEIPSVEFHKPKRVNESERVSIKILRDAAVVLAEESSTDVNGEMKILYDAAKILRNIINKMDKWSFSGSFTGVTEDKSVPNELYSFFRWVIRGPNSTLSTEKKDCEVNQHAMSLAQSTVFMFESKEQVRNKNSKTLRTTREMPRQLGIAIAVRQAFRSKKLVNMLHDFGLCVNYDRVLRLETQIATTVLERMLLNDGIYLPPDIVEGRFIFFAIDNIDFNEDTSDGKCTLHGTSMAIYQRCDAQDKAQITEIRGRTQNRSLKALPNTVTTLLDCHKPLSKPKSPAYISFNLKEYSPPELLEACLTDLAWLMGRSLVKSNKENVYNTPSTAKCIGDSKEVSNESKGLGTIKCSIPSWSAYNSLLTCEVPKTRVSVAPLIAAPAHEWKTLLTVLMQAQGINSKVVGSDRKTVITLDMGLYKPAKQLQMSRNDLDHIVLRPGELHVVMAQLRCIGAYIENSGLDLCWTEANLYGPATVKQILEGKHVKRGLQAHMVTLEALFNLYQDEFFQEFPHILPIITAASEHLDQSCNNGTFEVTPEAHKNLEETIKSHCVLNLITQFDSKMTSKPVSCVMLQYMQMVMNMMLFIRSVRTGNWKLHLATLATFSKYFFAHDKLNYAQMIPLYLAEMQSLEDTDNNIYQEFLDGNWVVNKNSKVSFCAIGADHALEHINRSMKVAGGLIGITLQPSARAKFFLISPELARIAEEAQQMVGVSSTTQTKHHALSKSFNLKTNKNIEGLTATLHSCTNPFAEESQDLFNLATKEVMPDEVKEEMCRQSDTGKQLLDDFVKERIKERNINLWAPMKKCKMQTFKRNGKTLTVASADGPIKLKEDRNLFARLLLVTKTRPEICIEDCIGNHELSVVPRSLFAADGTMLKCLNKSSLMAILEKLPSSISSSDREPKRIPNEITEDSHCGPSQQTKFTVGLIDGMAELQCFHKQESITNCSLLADSFTDILLSKFRNYDELHVIFDRYDVDGSLKSSTRERRLGKQPAIAYHITDTTDITNLTMKRFLSHVKTKKELTNYLANRILEKSLEIGRNVVVAWGCECRATHRNMSHLASSHEEADTKLLLHAVEVTHKGASKINIHSPDTDVFVLALRRYPELCADTNFVTGKGELYRTVPLLPIYEALGPIKASALPGLHAISGADNTGSFAGKGKISFWKAFKNGNNRVISALGNLGKDLLISEETSDALEEFICQVYLPNTQISQVHKLRWWLFSKKQAQSESLPPTKDALQHAILRSHHQAIIWNNDTNINPIIPSPENYGWKMEGGVWIPILTKQLPAPQCVLQLVKCGCTTSRCQGGRCSCRKAGLLCCDMCSCFSGNHDIDCNNSVDPEDLENDDLEEDSDGFFEDTN